MGRTADRRTPFFYKLTHACGCMYFTERVSARPPGLPFSLYIPLPFSFWGAKRVFGYNLCQRPRGKVPIPLQSVLLSFCLNCLNCLIFYQLSGGFLSKSYRLPSPYGSIPRPSRDHLATITDVYVTSLSSLSPFPHLRQLVPDLIRLSLLAGSADCQSAFRLTADRLTPFFINSHTRVSVCILRKGCQPSACQPVTSPPDGIRLSTSFIAPHAMRVCKVNR